MSEPSLRSTIRYPLFRCEMCGATPVKAYGWDQTLLCEKHWAEAAEREADWKKPNEKRGAAVSEPSLRSTEPWLTDELVELAAQAIYEYRHYGHFTDPRPNPDAAEHWRREARCWLAKVGPALALRVIHTQRDALIADYVRRHTPPAAWGALHLQVQREAEAEADAVLATLGAQE